MFLSAMCINPIFRVHLKADVTSLKSKSKTFVSLIIWEVLILRSVLLEHPVFSLDCYWINEKHEVDKCKLRCRQNVFSPLFFDCGVALINTWCANIQTWLKVSVWHCWRCQAVMVIKSLAVRFIWQAKNLLLV